MTPFAVLCSGQGAQTPALFEQFPFTATGLDLKRRILASGCVPPEIANWLDHPAAQPGLIFQDHFAQPLLCLYQAMVWAELSARLPLPMFVAGYSLGELSSYGCAGALAPESVVALAATRARLMDAAAPSGKLIAVTGLAVSTATALAARHSAHVAIIMSDDHCVIGCRTENADALAAALRTVARGVVPLPVSVASHTPILESAVAPFRQTLAAVDCHPFQFPVLAGVNAAKVTSPAQMVQWLPEQIHHTIRWDLVSSRLIESGCHVLLELGPGCQLAHLALAASLTRDARAVGEFRSVDGIVAWIEKSCGRAD